MGNLLYIDYPVSNNYESRVSVLKQSLSNSAVFEKLKVSKEIGWAFVRIIQGDIFSFRKLMRMGPDDVPQNHKHFLQIIIGLVGMKNSIVDLITNNNQGSSRKTIQEYTRTLIKYFSKYEEGTKDNSVQFAQWNLLMTLKINPLWWYILEDNYKKINEGTEFVQAKQDYRNRPYSNVLEILIQFNLRSVDENILEFLFDFALY
jgi:hypothetical protein